MAPPANETALPPQHPQPNKDIELSGDDRNISHAQPHGATDLSSSPTAHSEISCSPPLSPRITLDPGTNPFSPPGNRTSNQQQTPSTKSIEQEEGPTILSTGEVLPAPIIIPPYWSHKRQISSTSNSNSNPSFPTGFSHYQSSSGGGSGGGNGQIRLEDNTTPEAVSAGLRSPLWARLVRIDSYTIVSGNVKSGLFGTTSSSITSPSRTNTSSLSSAAAAAGGSPRTSITTLVTSGVGVGDYVVWSCCVRMLDGGDVRLHKRYSEFEMLRRELLGAFPRAGSSLPVLPPKSVFYRFRPAFLEKRRAGLEYFLNCVLLNPEFASSAVLKEFVFS